MIMITIITMIKSVIEWSIVKYSDKDDNDDDHDMMSQG